MWVRSQNKFRLTNGLVTYTIDSNYQIRVHNESYPDNRRTVLAAYSTEEKALTVMDMLEKHIDGLDKKYIVKDRGNPDGYEVLDNMYIPNQNGKITRIFQMPQDDEV